MWAASQRVKSTINIPGYSSIAYPSPKPWSSYHHIPSEQCSTSGGLPSTECSPGAPRKPWSSRAYYSWTLLVGNRPILRRTSFCVVWSAHNERALQRLQSSSRARRFHGCRYWRFHCRDQWVTMVLSGENQQLWHARSVGRAFSVDVDFILRNYLHQDAFKLTERSSSIAGVVSVLLHRLLRSAGVLAFSELHRLFRRPTRLSWRDGPGTDANVK